MEKAINHNDEESYIRHSKGDLIKIINRLKMQNSFLQTEIRLLRESETLMTDQILYYQAETNECGGRDDHDSNRGSEGRGGRGGRGGHGGRGGRGGRGCIGLENYYHLYLILLIFVGTNVPDGPS